MEMQDPQTGRVYDTDDFPTQARLASAIVRDRAHAEVTDDLVDANAP